MQSIIILTAICCIVAILLLLLWSSRIQRHLFCSCIIGVTVFFLLFSITVNYGVNSFRPIITVSPAGANQDAGGSEIWISELIVDGKGRLLPDPVKGKWIRDNNQLGWRNYRETYKQTTEIEIQLPVGREYSLVTAASKWRGILRISFGGQELTIDCYRSDEQDRDLTIPLDFVGLNQKTAYNRFVIGSATFWLLCSALTVWLLNKRFSKNPKKFDAKWKRAAHWIQDNRFGLIISSIAAMCFVVLVLHAGDSSLWNDDIAQIDYTAPPNSFSQMLHTILYRDPTTPPLSFVLMFFWTRILPYGTIWMRIPSIMLYCLSIVLCANTANRLGGRRMGYLCAVLMACSYFGIVEAGYSLRPYALLVFCSTLLLKMYHRRLIYLGKETKRQLIPFTVTIVLLLYTHYFAVFVVAAFFLTDVVVLLFQKGSFRALIVPYIVAGIVFVPWFILGVRSASVLLATFWPAVPKLQDINWVILTFVGDNQLVLSIFYLGVIAFGYSIWCHIQKGTMHTGFFTAENIVQTASLLAIALAFGIVFIYSAYLRPDRSVFYPRYFLCVFPMVCLLAAQSIDWLCQCLRGPKQEGSERLATCLCLLLCVTLAKNSYAQLKQQPYVIKQDYEYVVDWIYDADDSHRDDSLAIFNSWFLDPGIQYYVTHNDSRPPINTSSADISQEDLLAHNILFIHQEHGEISQRFWDIVRENYELQYEHPEYPLWVYEK